mgnify:FL=1
MEQYLLTNRCTKVRVKTSDGHTLKVFSVFYEHVALLDPDSWSLLDVGEKILVDVDTKWLLSHHESEFGYAPKDGTVLTCKITPLDKSNLEKHWNDMLDHCIQVKKEFAEFVDSKKVDDLSEKLDDLKVKSESELDERDQKPNDRNSESIPEETKQTPPTKLTVETLDSLE